jgi:hypothetical protein
MIALLASTIIQVPTQQFDMSRVPESVARYCASAVGIPYASDNFSNNDWERFKGCVYMQMGVNN